MFGSCPERVRGGLPLQQCVDASSASLFSVKLSWMLNDISSQGVCELKRPGHLLSSSLSARFRSEGICEGRSVLSRSQGRVRNTQTVMVDKHRGSERNGKIFRSRFFVWPLLFSCRSSGPRGAEFINTDKYTLVSSPLSLGPIHGSFSSWFL